MVNPIEKALRFLTTEPEANPPVWPDTDESKVIIVTPEDCLDPLKLKTLQELVSDPYDPNSVNAKDQYGKPPVIVNGTFTSANHFSRRRRAVLFAPGKYQIDLQVGYYSQVCGLGQSAKDVVFEDYKMGNTVVQERYGIFCPALDRTVCNWGLCLNTFWRSAENFTSDCSGRSKQYSGLDAKLGMQWAVSQAAPLRRVHCKKGLTLGDGGAFSSGGFLANAKIDGKVDEAAQQQFFHRNVQFNGGVSGGAWSLVFSGCIDEFGMKYPASDQAWGDPSKGEPKPAITVAKTPVVRMEKPYICLKKDGTKFELRVPKPIFNPKDTVGPRLDGAGDEVRDFAWVRVVRSDETNPTARIQEALDQGKDVVLAAGIFELTKTIEVKKADCVILGIGMATLIAPADGSPCIHVRPNCAGVRLAGLILEASPREKGTTFKGTSSLLEWGDESVSDAGDAWCPGAMFDLFCCVGGGDTNGDRTQIFVDTMVRLHSGNVIGDNLWLWRADHAKLRDGEKPNYSKISTDFWQTQENEFQVKKVGLEVRGDDITIYGLAVEHVNGHQVVWKGDRGTVVFYQSELPYDVTQTSFGDPQYRGYLMDNPNMKEHTLYAPGVYSNFRDAYVKVDMAIQTPGNIPVTLIKAGRRNLKSDEATIHIVNPFTVLLDGKDGILSIVDEKGDPAQKKGIPSFMNDYYMNDYISPKNGASNPIEQLRRSLVAN